MPHVLTISEYYLTSYIFKPNDDKSLKDPLDDSTLLKICLKLP